MTARSAPAGLGAGMTPRFVLLIVLFVTGSAYMLTNVFSPFTDPHELQSGCELAAGANPNVNTTANELLTSTPAYNMCLDTYVSGWRYVWLPYLTTAVLLVLALLLYVLWPRWQARTGKVVPLALADRDGALGTALEGLAERSGLSRPPSFVVHLAARKADALVFGRLGRYTVRIDLPLLTIFGRDRPAFDATLLHEFAHIRNRDVDITYLTVAIWRIFVLGALLPYALRTAWLVARGALWHVKSEYWSGDAPYWIRSLVLSAFIVALVYLVRADILQNREIYADIEAVRQGADRSRWAIHLAAGGRGRSRVLRALRTAVRTHPDWRARMAALVDPSGLFTVRARSMFLTGATAEVLGYFLFNTPATGQYPDRFPWLVNTGTWLPAVLVTGISGLAVWRSVVYSVRNRLPVPSGLRAGLWLGAGNMAGELLANPATANQWLITSSEILLLPLLLIVPTAVLWWTAGCATLWADLPSRRRRLAAATCTLAATGLAFIQLYDWWQTLNSAYATGNPFGADFAYATFYSDLTHTPTLDTIAAATDPVVQLTDRWNLVLTAALWLVPMIGLARRTLRRLPPAVNAGRFRLGGRVLSVGGLSGLLCGAAGAAGVLVITSRAHLWAYQGDQSNYQVQIIYVAWVFAILLAATAVAAVVTSVATRGDPPIAMAAAGSAMAIGLVVLLAITETDGCVRSLRIVQPHCTPASGFDQEFLTFHLWYVLTNAGVVSLTVALLATVFIKLWSPLDPAAPPVQEPEPPPTRRTFRTAWTALACALLAAACASTYVDDAAKTHFTHDLTPHAIALAPNVPVSPQVRTQQVRAWVYLGGKQLIGRWNAAIGNIINAAPGGHPNPPAMRRACAALGQIAKRGQAYFPPPDDQKPAWSASLATTVTGARECVDGLDHGDQKVLTSGLGDITAAQGTALQLIKRLAEESHGRV